MLVWIWVITMADACIDLDKQLVVKEIFLPSPSSSSFSLSTYPLSSSQYHELMAEIEERDHEIETVEQLLGSMYNLIYGNSENLIMMIMIWSRLRKEQQN